MKTLKIKDICDKGSSALKQKDVEGKEGKYPVFGASGYIGSIDTYHQGKDYIAIVKDGSGIGRVTFMPAYSSVIGTMQYILPKEGYNIKYISYCLQSLDLAKYKQGAAIPHIYFRDYGERYVNIEESLPEQERIVSLLDAEFAKIDAIKANAEKQLQDAKALFQSALKDYLTPKEGWSYNSFNEIYAIKMGKTPPRADKSMWDVNKETDNLWVSVADITSNEGRDIVSTKEHISECAAQKMHIVPQGSLLMSFKLTIGKMAFAGKNLYTNEAIIAIPDDGCYKLRFLYYYLSSYNWDTLTVGAEKVKGKTLNKSSISRIKLPIISLSDQQQIAEQLDKLSAKIQSLQSNFDTTVTLCNDLKQSILKDIFG